MQLEKIRQARALNISLTFNGGDDDSADHYQRSIQRPRAFYRRELEANPLILARKQ